VRSRRRSHHVEEEEEEILLAVRRGGQQPKLSDLGREFTEAKDRAAAELS
jgi:hypothetical protein